MRIYTIHREDGARVCRLDSIALRKSLGITSIEFTNIRAAAIFAQRHAAGAQESILRIFRSGSYDGDRPIPPLEKPFPPGDDEDFYKAFLSLPIGSRKTE